MREPFAVRPVRRGMKRALSAMVRAIGNENKEKKISHIVISHGGQEAGAYEVNKKLNRLPDRQIDICLR